MGGGGGDCSNLRLYLGKRYVPEKEYIHMISSYITADWSMVAEEATFLKI